MHCSGKIKVNMPKNKQKHTGFTLVELLIVIVVIAILATVSIVAYNGVQIRAKNTQLSSVAANYAKALQLYKVDEGELPSLARVGNNGYACLGDYADSTCSNHSTHTSSPTFNNLMKKYLSSAELPSLPEEYVYTNNYNHRWRGVFYRAHEKNLWFVQFKASECPSIGASVQVVPLWAYDNNLICQVDLE